MTEGMKHLSLKELREAYYGITIRNADGSEPHEYIDLACVKMLQHEVSRLEMENDRKKTELRVQRECVFGSAYGWNENGPNGDNGQGIAIPVLDLVREVESLRARNAVLERVRVAAEALPMLAPNHDHKVDGHWDSDGALCRICAARIEFIESLEAARQEVEK